MTSSAGSDLIRPPGRFAALTRKPYSCVVVIVLVVDDETDIRQALAEVLTFEGYQVVDARDGQEALDKARQYRPELVLLDLMMPRMNGWEFRRAQKGDRTLARIPVVVLSAFEKDGDLDAEAYIEKPFDVEELVSAVRRYARPTVQQPSA